MELEGLDLSDPLGIALVAIGVFVAFKAAKLVIKLAMAIVSVIGLYLWLGVSAG